MEYFLNEVRQIITKLKLINKKMEPVGRDGAYHAILTHITK